jgi:hypothetical protein
LESSFITKVSPLIYFDPYFPGHHPKTDKIEQLPYSIMANPFTRPKLYFNHSDILDSTLVEKPNFCLYLHENMLNFYADIDDVANCLETFSFNDKVTNEKSYQFDVRIYQNSLTFFIACPIH